MGSLSIWHWMLVIVVVLLVFGRGKISELMGDVAGGIKAFKKGMAEDDTPKETTKPEVAKTIDHQPTETTAAGLKAREAMLTINVGFALTTLGARADLLYVALQLTLALALVRLAAFGMRLMLGRETWFDAWEGRIAVAVWLVIALELLGWLEKIQATLEHVHLIPGRNMFTLWELVKGIVVVTVFVFVTTFVARTVERRVMRLGSIALSTRIGISKFTYFVLLGIGVLLGINAAGVDVTTLNVLTGGIGIGLGFGLQTIAGKYNVSIEQLRSWNTLADTATVRVNDEIILFKDTK